MKERSLIYLVEFHDLWSVFLLINLLFSFQQGIFAVPTTTDSVVVLLVQNGAHTADAADAAAAGAVDAVG